MPIANIHPIKISLTWDFLFSSNLIAHKLWKLAAQGKTKCQTPTAYIALRVPAIQFSNQLEEKKWGFNPGLNVLYFSGQTSARTRRSICKKTVPQSCNRSDVSPGLRDKAVLSPALSRGGENHSSWTAHLLKSVPPFSQDRRIPEVRTIGVLLLYSLQ